MARYEKRLATRISREANARLRFAVCVRGTSLSALLTELILGQLPPAPPEMLRAADEVAA